MNHTQGPWTILQRTKQEGKFDTIQIGPVGYAVCSVHCFGENAPMNAALIAAAPEMYEALKSINQMLIDGKLVRDISKDHRMDWALEMMDLIKTLNQVQMAVLKAEGNNGSRVD